MAAFPARRMVPIRTPACRLFATGTTALLLGSLVYLLWRQPGSAALLPSALQLALPDAPPLAGQLPAMLHAYAFTLLSVVALGARRRHAAAAALAWTTAGCLLEMGQLPAVASRLTVTLTEIGASGPLTAYFTGGTFDPLDICATALGAVAAYWTVCRVLRKGGNHENTEIIRAT